MTVFCNPGIYPPVAGPSARRRRKKRGNGWCRRSKKTSRQGQPLPPPPAPYKVSCGKCSSSILNFFFLLHLHPADHFSFFIQTFNFQPFNRHHHISHHLILMLFIYPKTQREFGYQKYLFFLSPRNA